MLGALLRATGLVDRELLVAEIRNRFGRIAEGNIKAFNRAYDECAVEA
jgi:Pyruvate/2-oxoacid:ferredoxin oxidoreductase gamma subunit